MAKLFSKNCPVCSRIQTYTQVGSFNRAVRTKVLCGKCAGAANSAKVADYVVNSDGCWLWNKSCFYTGYGQSHEEPAHVVYYRRYKGNIPKYLQIDHICHNKDLSCKGGFKCAHRRCVNPDHLEAVTRAVNQQRGRRAKINFKIVKFIRKNTNKTQRQLAKKFGISQRLVFNVIHNATWRNVDA